jgi:drug/metabolite transporter (DMT)-like permease
VSLNSATQSKGTLLALFAAVVWGSQVPISKWLFGYADTFSVTAFRYAIAVVFLLIILRLREGPQALSLRGPGVSARTTIALGLLGMCGSPSLVFGGLMLTRPEVAAVIIGAQPSLTALALWIVKGKRPDRFALCCVALAFLGVIMVVTRLDTNLLPHGAALVGDIFVLLGALCWVAYTIACERFVGWSSLRISTMAMVPGTVGNIALAALAWFIGFAQWPAAQDWKIVIGPLLFLAIFCVLLGMLAWAGAVARIGALNAMLFLSLIPVITFAVGYWRGSRFTTVELIGTGLVIVALCANNIHQRLRLAPASGK